MASLALLVSIIVLFTILIGPISLICAKLNFPNTVVYILAIASILVGVNFCFTAIPVWYIGLVPIYFGYASIRHTREKTIKG